MSALAMAAPHLSQADPLHPGDSVQVPLAAAATSSYELTLPPGTAVDIEMTQVSGFVDLELALPTGSLAVRTEAGVGGHIAATLLAATAQNPQIRIISRQGKGPATVVLSVSPLRSIAPADAPRSAAFASYVEAERLRRANYRETVVTARPTEIEQRTRAAYTDAAAAYAAAGDGCGLRRARIGLARMEVALGNHAEARREATAALSAGCDGDIAEQAQAYKTIGMAAAYQGDFTASAEAAEQALTLYGQTGDTRYRGIVLGNLSEVYLQLGATDRALEDANGALLAAEATADGQGVVFSRKSIAAVHLARGEFASALADYRRTLDVLSATPYPMIEGETWADLGILYHRMADYSQSLQAFAKARSVFRSMGYRVGEADTLISTAQTLLEFHRSREAIADLRLALQIARADGLRSAQVRALRGLGSASLSAGRPDAAGRYFAASLDLARATGELADGSYALRALGDLDYRRGRFARAQARDEEALALVRRAADRDGEAATLAALARDAAAGDDLPAALEHIEAALAIIETQRGQINDPSLRTSYFASMRAYPDTQIDILMRLAGRFPGHGYERTALAAAERARARSLADMFAERSIDVTGSIPAGLVAAQRAAEDRLSVAAFQLARADAVSVERRQGFVDAVDAASHALDEVRGRMRSANPRYADLLRPAPLDLAEVQQRLVADHGALLEYWLGSRASYVWIVTPAGVRALRLPPRQRIEALAGRLVALLRRPPDADDGAGFAGRMAADLRAAQSIDAAAAALAAALRTGETLRGLPRRLAVVADGELARIPFWLLRGGHRASASADGPDLSYLPSLTTLKFLRRADAAAAATPATLAVVAAPLLAGSARQPDLPFSRVEAETIAAQLPADRVWLALGAAASRATVLATDWHRYSIVHFATHARVDLQRPELSGILLSAYDAAGLPQDGMLRMNDIYGLDMPVDLVVLSGCDTAVGRDMESEGVFSLSRAFFYAGARHVIASLWPVEDRATAAFMAEFYRGLLVEHMSPGRALRIAQQHLAADGRWAAPYYWSGFVLQGIWD